MTLALLSMAKRAPDFVNRESPAGHLADGASSGTTADRPAVLVLSFRSRVGEPAHAGGEH